LSSSRVILFLNQLALTTSFANSRSTIAMFQRSDIPEYSRFVTSSRSHLNVATSNAKLESIAANFASRPGLAYYACNGLDIYDTYRVAQQAAEFVRTRQKPAFLHMRTVRLFGHAGADAEGVLGTDRLKALAHNPQELVSDEAQEGLRQTFAEAGPQGAPLLEGVMGSLRSALSSAIADVFLISLFVIIIAIVATMFLKEVPLRGRRSPNVEAQEASDSPVAAD